MGHGQRNANRAAGIAKNEARIGKLAEKLEELGKLVEKSFAAMTEKSDEAKESVAILNDCIEALQIKAAFNAQPFWKRWWQSYMDHKVALASDRVRAAMEIEKEARMPKEEEKKPQPPATPSHRQVVVDRKTPGPKKREGEPDGTKAESRDN